VPAAADDDDPVVRPRRRLSPGRLPSPVPRQRVPGEGKEGISLHRRKLAAAGGGAKRALPFLRNAGILPVGVAVPAALHGVAGTEWAMLPCRQGETE